MNAAKSKRIGLAGVALMAGLLGATASGEEDNRGTVRTYDAGAGRIAIDEGVYFLAPNAKFTNLAGGWTGPSALRKGTPVAFNADPSGVITEIVILPRDDEELQETGYAPPEH